MRPFSKRTGFLLKRKSYQGCICAWERPREGTMRGQLFEAKERGPKSKLTCWHLHFQPSELWENEFLLFKAPSTWYFFKMSALSRLYSWYTPEIGRWGVLLTLPSKSKMLLVAFINRDGEKSICHINSCILVNITGNVLICSSSKTTSGTAVGIGVTTWLSLG